MNRRWSVPLLAVVFGSAPLSSHALAAGAAPSGPAATAAPQAAVPPPPSPAPGAASPAGNAAAQKGPPVKLMQAKVVNVKLGLQTDTLAEVQSPDIKPGTTVITTRPDALQDRSVVAIGGPSAGAPHGAQ
ncbi:MAG TPA: hypothetical protein VFE70_06255 [Candidatus Elarobacter sp.]|nr:hypothetical protein [Candidatus Elarobacter sp.]